MSAGPIGPRQRAAFWSTGTILRRCSGGEALDGVDGAEHLGERRCRPSRSRRTARRRARRDDACFAPAHAGRPGSDVGGEAAPRVRLPRPRQAVDARRAPVRRRCPPRWAATIAPRSRPPNPGGGSTGSTMCPSDTRRVGTAGRVCHTSISASNTVSALTRRAGAPIGALGPHRSLRTRPCRLDPPSAASAITRSTIEPMPPTAVAHGRCAIPYGGRLASSWSRRSIASRRALASIGSFASRSAHRNMSLSAPSGGPDSSSSPEERSSPASIASSRSSTACSASAATSDGRAVPAVRHFRCDQRLCEDVAILVRPFVEAELGRLGIVCRARWRTARRPSPVRRRGHRHEPRPLRARPLRRRPRHGAGRRRRAPRTARPAGRSSTTTRRSGP